MMSLAQAFERQSRACTSLGSPFMGQLMGLCAARWPEVGRVAEAALNWQGDPSPAADSLPLRIAGGLHALVIDGQAPELAALYPPNTPSDEALWTQIEAALETHADWLCRWLQNPPQTNEIRRAASLIPVAHLLAGRFGLSIKLSEMGASGGLNLQFDSFQLSANGATFGPDSDILLAPDWQGPSPAPTDIAITDRRGVDLHPVNAGAPEGRLKLLAYLWPDQPERLARTKAALNRPLAQVDKAPADTWLPKRLTHQPNTIHMIYTTIAWQYFSQKAKDRITAAIQEAGANATETAPLAWFSMETDNSGENGALMRLRLWPGDVTLKLGRIDFHGRWVTWSGPTSLQAKGT